MVALGALELDNLKIDFKHKYRLCIVLIDFCVTWKLALITTVVSFVTDPPDIAVDPQNRTATEGNNVTLSCNVSGNPEPSISWTIDEFQVNTTINSRVSLSADKKELTITKAKRTDNGNYRCVANNSLGIATSDAATVDVQCKSSMLVNKSKPNSCTITHLYTERTISLIINVGLKESRDYYA